MDTEANSVVALFGVVGSMASGVGTYLIVSRRARARIDLQAIERGGSEAAKIAAGAVPSFELNTGTLSQGETLELAKQEIENRDRRDRRVLILTLTLTLAFAVTTAVCLGIVSGVRGPKLQTDTGSARDQQSDQSSDKLPRELPPPAQEPPAAAPRPPRDTIQGKPRKKVDTLQHDEVLNKLQTKLQTCARLEMEEVRTHCEMLMQKSIQERLAFLAANRIK